MHIALFTDLHPASLGGAQISVAAQRQALERIGHQVTVFTAPLAKSIDPDPCVVELKRVPVVANLISKLGRHDDFVFVWPGRSNQALIDKAFLERDPIDIVHTQGDLGVCMAGVEAARRHGIPVVQTKHTRYDVYFEQASPNPLLITTIFSQMQKRHLKNKFSVIPVEESAAARLSWNFMVAHAEAVDHEITPTRHFAEALAQRGITRPISVISNGVDDDVIDHARHARSTTLSDGGPLRLVWCGRLSSEKRILEAIDAVTQVDDCTLDVYGEGHLEASIRKRLESGGLAQRIRLHGRVSQEDCLTAMGSSDALLFTSYGFDTQGMVLLEAVAMSLPTIYCDPRMGETVPEGGGVLSGDASAASLAKAIRGVAADRGKLRKMADVVTAYQDTPRQSLQTEKIVAIYKGLVDRRPPTGQPESLS